MIIVGLTGDKPGCGLVAQRLCSEHGFIVMPFSEPVFRKVMELDPKLMDEHGRHVRLSALRAAVGAVQVWTNARYQKQIAEFIRTVEVAMRAAGGPDVLLHSLDARLNQLSPLAKVVIPDVWTPSEGQYVSGAGQLWAISRHRPGSWGSPVRRCDIHVDLVHDGTQADLGAVVDGLAPTRNGSTYVAPSLPEPRGTGRTAELLQPRSTT